MFKNLFFWCVGQEAIEYLLWHLTFKFYKLILNPTLAYVAFSPEIPPIFKLWCGFQRCLRIYVSENPALADKNLLKYLLWHNHHIFKLILNPTWVYVAL
jgi:hypothetical protein